MSQKRQTKLVHEGQFVAELEVHLIESEQGWSPSFSLADAERLDEVRDLLRQGDTQRASQLARVYRLMPVSA